MAGFDGYLRELNPSWTKTLGWSPEELKSSPYQTLIHPEDREATVEAEECLLLRQKISGFENRIFCKDGSYRWISWSSVVDIKRREFFLVGLDVTENKKLAEALLSSERKYRTIFDCAGDSLFVGGRGPLRSQGKGAQQSGHELKSPLLRPEACVMGDFGWYN